MPDDDLPSWPMFDGAGQVLGTPIIRQAYIQDAVLLDERHALVASSEGDLRGEASGPPHYVGGHHLALWDIRTGTRLQAWPVRGIQALARIDAESAWVAGLGWIGRWRRDTGVQTVLGLGVPVRALDVHPTDKRLVFLADFAIIGVLDGARLRFLEAVSPAPHAGWASTWSCPATTPCASPCPAPTPGSAWRCPAPTRVDAPPWAAARTWP